MRGRWTPFPATARGPSPQQLAQTSEADELFFGGASGGGKSDLALGLAVTAQSRSLVLRREAVQLTALVDRLKDICGAGGQWRSSGYGGTMRFGTRTIELAGCEHEDDKAKYQGRPHDYLAFDEAAHFSPSQYRFIIGWNRTEVKGQRCRVVLTGNPPTNPEGRWVVEEWAPWLDPTHHDPAEPGTLRWYTYLEGKLTWLKESTPFTHKGEVVTPRSRTFIPARVQDNPVYMATGYVSTLQAMPEPLRSQMLYGDFSAGTEDDARQVIPTSWVRAAQARWSERGGDAYPLTSIGVDVARGGSCKTTFAPRRGPWLARLHKYPGASTPDAQKVRTLLCPLLVQKPDVPVHIDANGVGAAVYDLMKEVTFCRPRAVMVSNATDRRDRAGVLTFANLRSWAYWHVRDVLDPLHGEEIALPPDPELLADLCAPRWEMRSRGVQVERKEDITARIGRSPDCGDSVVLALLPPSYWQVPQSVPVVEPARQAPREFGPGNSSGHRGHGLFGRV